jgi:hypothetical protein
MFVDLVIEPPYLCKVTLGSPPCKKNLGCPQLVSEDGVYEVELVQGF